MSRRAVGLTIVVTMLVAMAGAVVALRGGGTPTTSVAAMDDLAAGLTMPSLVLDQSEVTTTTGPQSPAEPVSGPTSTQPPLRPGSNCGLSKSKAKRSGDIIGVTTSVGPKEIALADGSEHVIGGGTQVPAYPAWAEWSSSGRFVAHTRDNAIVVTDVVRDCSEVIVKADPAKPDTRLLAWSPDESRVAFVQHDYREPRPGQVEVIGRDGRGRRALVKGDGGVAWAPDGSGRIAFCDPDGVKVFDERTGKVRMIHATTAFAEYPGWSPDATRLVFSASTDTGVWVAPASGGGGRRITESFQVFWSSWSPDGKQIAYGYDGGLWIVDADGARPHAIAGLAVEGKAHWSPDGSRIAFSSGGGPAPSTVHLVDADGSNLRRLSGDGRVVAFFRR